MNKLQTDKLSLHPEPPLNGDESHAAVGAARILRFDSEAGLFGMDDIEP